MIKYILNHMYVWLSNQTLSQKKDVWLEINLTNLEIYDILPVYRKYIAIIKFKKTEDLKVYQDLLLGNQIWFSFKSFESRSESW